MSDPVWLPDVLRAEGLQCDIFPGAFERGHGDFGNIWGVVCHHTGSFGETPNGIANHPTLGLASQLYLSPQGVYTLCGVGVAWHAGSGSWPGIATDNANQVTIGIEAANDGGGTPGKPHRSSWSDAQYDAYVRGVAAILRHLGVGPDRAIGHKEWAGAAQGKWDPGAIDMNIFRQDVGNILAGATNRDPVEELMATNQEKFDGIADPDWGELRKRFPDRSMYRTSNDLKDTLAGFVLTATAYVWDNRVEACAERGEQWAIDLVKACATGTGIGVLKADGTPDQFLIDHAKAVLTRIGK